MTKKKCPHCGSVKTVENQNYFSCMKCFFLHKKTEREKNGLERSIKI